MERNRVLWVIFSISLFLVVVLGVGLYLLRPVTEKGGEAAAQAAVPASGFDAFEYVRGRSELPGIEQSALPATPEDVIIVIGEGGQTPAALPAPAIAPPAAPRPSAPLPASPATPAPPAASPAPKGSARTAPEPTRATKSVTEYWIQMVSVSSLGSAEEAARSLEQQGLAPVVTTRELSGKTYYRVRVGPYPTKAEAEKFLQWVRGLEGYESSYIALASARRPAP
jgi:cell division septation protein DedD